MIGVRAHGTLKVYTGATVSDRVAKAASIIFEQLGHEHFRLTRIEHEVDNYSMIGEPFNFVTEIDWEEA